MLKIWTIVKYTFLSNVRDKRSIISYLLFPIILIIILGSALSAAFGATNISDIKLGVVVEEESTVSKNLKKFIKGDDIGDIISSVDYDSLDDVKEAIESGEISVAIEIPKDFNGKILNGEQAEFRLWTYNAGSYQTTVTKTLMDTYMNAINTVLTLRDHDKVVPSYELRDTIDDKSISLTGNRAGSMDYYAVTIMIMALMYGAAIAAREYEMNMRGKMGNRLRTSPAGTIPLLIGKTISCIIIVFIQGMVIVMVSKYAFGSNWGNDMWRIMLYILLGSIVSTEIGIMISVLVGNPEKVGGILTLLVPLMTLVSGGFVKASFGGIEKIVPNYQLQNLILKTIYGGDASAIMRSLIYVLVLIVAMLIISVVVGRRKRTW